MSTNRFLVTGVAGFIGSHIAETLLARGIAFRGVDNFATGNRENLDALNGDFEFIEGDLRDPDLCARVTRDIDVILHQAAIPSVPRSVAEPRESHDANATATMNLLIAGRNNGVRRLVYAGSSSAYGCTEVFPAHEDLPADPRSPYAASKLAGELYCRAFGHCYDIETVIIRYFNVFGPRQDPFSPYGAVIPRFVEAFLAGRRPVIFGDGTQSRDFTYVQNNVHANLLAADAADVNGEIINVAGGEEVSVVQVAEKIAACLGVECRVTHEPARAGDVPRSLGNLEKARRLLGYQTQVGFDEGLKHTVAWFRKHLP